MYRLTRSVTSSAMPASRRWRPARILSSQCRARKTQRPWQGIRWQSGGGLCSFCGQRGSGGHRLPGRMPPG